jgi:hypothetical protein
MSVGNDPQAGFGSANGVDELRRDGLGKAFLNLSEGK